MATPPGPAELDALERETVDLTFELQPSYAVSLGLHEYDGRLPDLSRAATDAWAQRADALLARLARIAPETLSPDRAVDRFLLRLLLESSLFDLREAHDLERNPMAYVGSLSLTPYLVRDYAPAATRARAVIRTLEAVPRVLDQGRERLEDSLPRPFVELALTIAEGLPGNFTEAEAFVRGADPALGPPAAAARATAEVALASFVVWLREKGLPNSTPDFALGPERFQRLLFVREGIEAPYAELERAGRADLERNQARLMAIAASEGLDVPALLARVSGDHPSAKELIPVARSVVDQARRFVEVHALATVPSNARLRVEETPAWSRALTTASMDSPGPFETQSDEGVYYVTPVDDAWTATQQEEWLRSFNRSTLLNTAVHEVYPGHYLQFLHYRAAGVSLTRKVFCSAAFIEGWAHYAEQLAIENGLGGGNPLAEVAQIHDALLRNCRLLVSIGLHTRGMTLDEATALFEREGHIEHLPSVREAIRGTRNPEYFCYTLGKLEILDVRRRHLASRFHGSLQKFHDTLLGFGCPPVGILDSLLSRVPP